MKATVTYHNGYLYLKPQSGVLLADRRELNRAVRYGGRWIAQWQSYRYPAVPAVCVRLREVWGDGLQLTDAVRTWYCEEQRKAAAQALRSMQTDATLTRLPQVAPRLAATLRPDQRAGAAWFAQGYRNGGLLADQPGTGKTLTATAGLHESDLTGPVLVVAPRLSVKRVWQKELQTWTDTPVFIARGTRAHREKAIARFMACTAERKVLVVVAEMLRVRRPEKTGSKTLDRKRGRSEGFEFPQLFSAAALGGGWAWVLADESHKLLGSLTIARSNMAGEGLALLPVRSGGQRRAITGTPFGKGGRVQGMFGTLHWLWPDEYKSFWQWAERYWEIEQEKVYLRGGGGAQKTVMRLGAMLITEEEIVKELGPRVLRRTKAEVLPHLPPKHHIKIPCEMTPAQAKQYEALAKDAEFATEHGFVLANGVLALRTRAKQIAAGVLDKDAEGNVIFTGESGKIDTLFDMLETRGILEGQPQEHEDDVKVIVASEYNELLSAVCQRLKAAGVPHYLLTGKTSDTQRDKQMDSFQQFGGPRVFVLNSKAGGISVTLDAADEVHKLTYLDDPGDDEQLDDRIHRASRVHRTRFYCYESEGTVDEKAGYDLETKRYHQWKILDGRRGLEYVRSMITYRKPQGD